MKKLKFEKSCPICKKKFLTPTHLSDHRRRYCGVTANIICGHCDHRSKRMWDMKVHVMGVHGISKANVKINHDIIKIPRIR